MYIRGQKTDTKVKNMKVRTGECLIINQIEYGTSSDGDFKKRAGSEIDEQRCVKEWENLGCNTNVERNLTKDELKRVLKHFRDVVLPKAKPDYMVLIIMGHGRLNCKTKLDEIMGVMDIEGNMEGLSLDYIIELFIQKQRCPPMANKLKLFVFQACRGNESQKQMGNKVEDCVEDVANPVDLAERIDGRNKHSPDMNIERSWYHILYSTMKGYAAYRDPVDGSLFIQTFCDILREDSHVDDINTISGSVVSHVMTKYKHVQVPVSSNSLGDKIYFSPKNGPSIYKRCRLWMSQSLLYPLIAIISAFLIVLGVLLFIFIFVVFVFLMLRRIQDTAFEDVISMLHCTMKCSLVRIGRIFEGKNPFEVIDECVATYQENCCNCNNFFWEEYDK